MVMMLKKKKKLPSFFYVVIFILITIGPGNAVEVVEDDDVQSLLRKFHFLRRGQQNFLTPQSTQQMLQNKLLQKKYHNEKSIPDLTTSSSSTATTAIMTTVDDDSIPRGVSFQRNILELPAGASFHVSMNNDNNKHKDNGSTNQHCSKQDQYGDDKCIYHWGENITGSFSLTIPNMIFTSQDQMIGTMFFDNILPFHFHCPICGQDCIFKAPLIHLNWTLHLPKCPSKQQQQQNNTVISTTTGLTIHFNNQLPPTSPTNGLLPIGLNGTVQVVHKSSSTITNNTTTTNTRNHHKKPKTLLELSLDFLIK